jgi:hypothetical protein
MSSQLREMEDLARSYCELVEAASERDETWIQQVAGLLPQLHMAITALGGVPDDVEHNLVADLDARFELYGYLRKLLGDRDAYWMEFDAAHDKQCMSGSLADDLTDIYCELKHGLRLLDANPPQTDLALDGWRRSYKAHWGQHLVDAERHLYALRARGELAF